MANRASFAQRNHVAHYERRPYITKNLNCEVDTGTPYFLHCQGDRKGRPGLCRDKTNLKIWAECVGCVVRVEAIGERAVAVMTSNSHRDR
jgi:hypothetical protein